MRLRANADRNEVRQQYLPRIWEKTVGTLQEEGKDSVQDVIDFMDSYYLTKDDFDAMLELGVGPMDQEKVKIDTATKATFTRLYNSQSHPMPFVKASNVLGMAKGAAKKEKPDLEEAVDESEPDEILGPDVEPADEEDEELDLKKDKYIKASKKKSATAAAAKGKGKRKAKADGDDDGDDSEEQPPKKKKAAGGGRGGRKGKGKA